MEDIIKIVKSLEDSNLLLKGVRKTFQNEAEKQRGGFLGMLLGKLGAILLGNISADKGIDRARERIVRAGYGIKKGKGIERAGYGNK